MKTMPLAAVFAVVAMSFLACSSASGTGPVTSGGPPDETPDAGNTADGGKPPSNKDGGHTDKDTGIVDPGGDSGPDNPDTGPSPGCGDWQTGTLSGYNNSNFADDPNAGSVMEFTGLTNAFYDNVNIVSIDMSDWPNDQYKYIDINFDGTIGRVGAWDACANKDCPDGTSCCTNNKHKFADPGYLLDVETRTAQRLWGVANAENVLLNEVQYRICEGFDPDAIANQYGAKRN